jgi:hypothetical protein
MSGKLFSQWFTLSGVVVVILLLYAPATSSQAGPKMVTKWNYNIIDLDQEHCSTDALLYSLQGTGQQGWELISYQRYPGASGIVVQPAATGYGKTTIPQTADSFAGTITPGEKGCRLIFKRPES